MDQSPFARLPAELRNIIYEYALYEELRYLYVSPAAEVESFTRTYAEHPQTVVGECRRKRRCMQTETSSPLLGLPSTCKEIRKESRPVYFAVNCFHTYFGQYSRKCASAVVDALGRDMLRHATRFKLEGPLPILYQYRNGTLNSYLIYRVCRMLCELIDVFPTGTSCTVKVSIATYHSGGVGPLDQRTMSSWVPINDVEAAMSEIRGLVHRGLDWQDADERYEMVVADLANLEASMRRRLAPAPTCPQVGDSR